MKRNWILPILCVLVMVGASTGVSAVSHDFGTATTELDDDDASATAPAIDNWVYKLEDEGAAYLDVEVDCEFTDRHSQDADFSFYFLLSIDLWQETPPEYIEHHGSDSWEELNEDSGNWANFPVVHTDTLSVEIAWQPPPTNHMYKCTLDVNMENIDDEVTDSDSESWFITCTLN